MSKIKVHFWDEILAQQGESENDEGERAND